MRILMISAAALVIASPAYSKGHDMPSAQAKFGQENAGQSGARNADARGLDGSEKGVEGSEYSDTRSEQKGSKSGQKADMADSGSTPK
jgi:hypothetical protein